MRISCFHFKQFSIQQHSGMMKVCTDSCLFGAWLAAILSKSSAKNVLDIGSGTGLLSLMVAQKFLGHITAVELAEAAFEQAKINVLRSNWAHRISLIHQDIQQFEGGKFDFVFSNPPFYEKDLKSPQHALNMARHDASLTLSALVRSIDRLLLPGGEFALLIPATRYQEVLDLSQGYGYQAVEQVWVHQTTRHTAFRVFLRFRRDSGSFSSSTIYIRESNGNYSKDFSALLKDYYLNL